MNYGEYIDLKDDGEIWFNIEKVTNGYVVRQWRFDRHISNMGRELVATHVFETLENMLNFLRVYYQSLENKTHANED